MPPRVIFIIRHGEKPVTVDATTFSGIDVDGNPNPDSLIPQGWQRAGGLATLFDRAVGTMRTDLSVPTNLYAPMYPTKGTSAVISNNKTMNHRTYETILPLSLRLNLTIDTPFPEGQEADLAASILKDDAGVTLIAWEHNHIPDIAQAIPVSGEPVPSKWPDGPNHDGRFDIIWAFTRGLTGLPDYTFAQLPQFLLAGDAPA